MGIIKTKYSNGHYTTDAAEFNAKITMTIFIAGLIADSAFNVFGAFQLEEHLGRNWSIGYIGLYLLIGLFIAGFIILIIRSGSLRASTYYITRARMRSDKSIHGVMTEDQPEAAIVAQTNMFHSIVLLAAWVVTLGTNLQGFITLFGGYINIYATKPEDIAWNVIGCLFILMLTIAIPWGAHKGEFVGFHFKDHARTLALQDANQFNSIVKTRP